METAYIIVVVMLAMVISVIVTLPPHVPSHNFLFSTTNAPNYRSMTPVSSYVWIRCYKTVHVHLSNTKVYSLWLADCC